MVWKFGKVRVGHASLLYDLQRGLKIQVFLYLKSLKLSGSSRVVNVLGLFALDHTLPFPLIFIFVSLIHLSSKLCLQHCLAMQRVAHTLANTNN